MGESTVSDSFFCGEFFLLVILLSAEWLKASCTGKRKEKERKKVENKQKTKNKKTKQNTEGYPLVLYTINPSTSPGAFQRCWVKHLLFPCPSSWSSGGGAAVLILRCVHLGELPRPPPGARLSGSCLPGEAPVPWWPRSVPGTG